MRSAARRTLPKVSRNEHSIPLRQCRAPRLQSHVRSTTWTGVLVIAAALLVHSHLVAPVILYAATPQPRSPASDPAKAAPLPPAVAEMRDMILAAVQAQRIEDLIHAIEWNELPPEFGDEAGDDPIRYWKTISADGEGREVLDVLARLFDLPPARLPIGADLENNVVYVWPYLAELELDKLTPAHRADLMSLMPSSEADRLIGNKKWVWWRLAIGADGTWLLFMRPE